MTSNHPGGAPPGNYRGDHVQLSDEQRAIMANIERILAEMPEGPLLIRVDIDASDWIAVNHHDTKGSS